MNGLMLVEPSPPQPPPGFNRTTYEHEWEIAHGRERVWEWLCDPATFVDGQVPPFRVEFLPNDQGPGAFRTGVYNAHVGPFMSFAGVVGEIRESEYRDLQYFYGSYALSHALFRPVRLQFWLTEVTGGRSALRLQVDADIRRGVAERLWPTLMRLFWSRFGHWCERALRP